MISYFDPLFSLQVLNLVRHMVGLGYYGDTHRMRILLKPLLGLIDGRNDVPFDLTKGRRLERYSTN